MLDDKVEEERAMLKFKNIINMQFLFKIEFPFLKLELNYRGIF